MGEELKGSSYPQVLTLKKLALTTNVARGKTSCLGTTAGLNTLLDQPCPQKICVLELFRVFSYLQTGSD